MKKRHLHILKEMNVIDDKFLQCECGLKFKWLSMNKVYRQLRGKK